MRSSLWAVVVYVPLALLVSCALTSPSSPVSTSTTQQSSGAAQRGSTTLLPQIVQQGVEPARAGSARTAGTVKFSPARKGRKVIVQRKLGAGPWRKHVVRRQNGVGSVTFTGPARKGSRWFAYRGVAVRHHSLHKVASTLQRASVWERRFSDEFSGESLTQSKWSPRFLDAYSPDSDRACSASKAEAVKVGGGKVSLFLKKDRSQASTEECPNWYKNGHISTEGKFQARYGVAAARVRFARAQGAHGSFWLQSAVTAQEGKGPAVNGAEIDVVEYFGKGFLEGDVWQFLHYTDAGGEGHKVGAAQPKARRALKADDDWWKSYHVFSVQWTPRAYTFRVDGVKTFRTSRGVSGQPEFLILSMLSSGWELEKLEPGTLPFATRVDWVRYWQKR